MRKQHEWYDEHDAERWVAEPVKRPGRTAFARDRARVLHSAALRRLAAKTQVVTAGSDDFVRNRLTHSLEVAQIGRELAATIGCDPDIVDAACLSHDLGHPPFGHNGERALDQLAADIGGFEGNAQTLRLLTRLESKTFDADGRSVGLNLSRATLDAATKYPWPRRPGERKFGVYDDDLAVFTLVAPGRRRAALPRGAGDGLRRRRRLLGARRRGRDRCPPHRSRRGRRGPGAVLGDRPAAVLAGGNRCRAGRGLARLTSLNYWPGGPFDDSRRALGGLKDLTSQLIGRFATAAEQATHAVFGRSRLIRYEADLVIPDGVRVEIGLLKGVGMFHVLNSPERQARRASQRQLLTDLVEALWKAAPRHLDAAFRADFAEAADDNARLRVIVDQVASLTDPSAQAWHAQLVR